MKKVILFLLSFALVLALAVILSPLIYPHFDFKFHRIFNRIVMVGTLICVAVFVRIRKETFIEYGLAWKSGSLRQILAGFVAPVVVLSIYVAIQTFFGQAEFSFQNVGIGKWTSRIILALFTGVLIGSIEEFFFRGALFQFCFGLWATPNRRPQISLVASLFVTNIFYAIVHFVHAKRPFIDSTPDLRDSLMLLGAPFASLTEFGVFWPGLVGLFIFGLMLNGLYLRTKSLYASIGLHAGAVFFIKTDGLLVNFGSNDLLWGSGKMYDGIIGWFALCALYGVLLIFLPRITNDASRETR